MSGWRHAACLGSTASTQPCPGVLSLPAHGFWQLLGAMAVLIALASLRC